MCGARVGGCGRSFNEFGKTRLGTSSTIRDSELTNPGAAASQLGAAIAKFDVCKVEDGRHCKSCPIPYGSGLKRRSGRLAAKISRDELEREHTDRKSSSCALRSPATTASSSSGAGTRVGGVRRVVPPDLGRRPPGGPVPWGGCRGGDGADQFNRRRACHKGCRRPTGWERAWYEWAKTPSAFGAAATKLWVGIEQPASTVIRVSSVGRVRPTLGRVPPSTRHCHHDARRPQLVSRAGCVRLRAFEVHRWRPHQWWRTCQAIHSSGASPGVLPIVVGGQAAPRAASCAAKKSWLVCLPRSLRA